MSSKILNRNRYTFTWVVKNFATYILHSSSLEVETKSPIFNAETLAETSWFLSLRVVEDDSKEISVECSLCRDKMDGGPEIIEIDWMLEIRLAYHILFKEEEGIIVNTFRRGSSHTRSVFKVKKNILRRYSMKIQCHMSACLPVEKPIFASSTVLTEANSSSFYLKESDITSNKLTLSCHEDAQFEFCFHTSNDDIRIRICRTDKSNDIKCYLIFAVSNIHSYGGEHYLIKYRDTHKNFDQHYVLEMPYSLKVSEILDAVKNKMQLWIKIIFISSVFSTKCPDSRVIDELQDDFLRMYTDRIHADVNFQIGDDAIPAHKCVLSARSPVLSAMFSHETTENKEGIVNIIDMEAKTLNLLLKFMYTGAVDEIEYESVLKLLLASEKYQMLSLNKMCCDYLVSVLSVSNVCDVLNIANLVNNNNLKMLSMDYFKTHADEILLSDNWKQLAEKNIVIVSEILKYLSNDLGTRCAKK